MSDLIEVSLTVPVSLKGRRLDQALSSMLPQYSRSLLTKWIKSGFVTVESQPCKPRDVVNGLESVVISAPLSSSDSLAPEEIPLNIVYEDDSLLVVDKPVGLVVHPGAGNPSGTLVNALLYHAPSLSNLPRAGIVHRLDKDTSGLLIVAKTLSAHHRLVKMMQAREISRCYQAVVRDIVLCGGTIDKPIGRHPINRKKMAICDHGKLAITHYRVKKKFRAHTLLDIQLETGRTHQIRVHLASIKHPIVGDPLYGNAKFLPQTQLSTLSSSLSLYLQQFKRQALHAYKLQLQHPETAKHLSFNSTFPSDFNYLVGLLDEDLLVN